MNPASGAILLLLCGLAVAEFYYGLAEAPSLESNDNRIGREIGSFFDRVLSRAFSLKHQGYRCRRCRKTGAETNSGNKSTTLSGATIKQDLNSTANSSISQITENVGTNSDTICGGLNETSKITTTTTAASSNNNSSTEFGQEKNSTESRHDVTSIKFSTEFGQEKNSTETRHDDTSIECDPGANSTLPTSELNTTNVVTENSSSEEMSETSILVESVESGSPSKVNEPI